MLLLYNEHFTKCNKTAGFALPSILYALDFYRLLNF